MTRRRLLLWVLLAPPLLAGVLLAAGWAWLGREGSLAFGLAQTARWLAAQGTLETSEVTGTVRDGGRIGRLHWRAAGLEVEARALELDWEPTALFSRRLRVAVLRIGELAVTTHDDGTAAGPPRPPPLPLDVDLGFEVRRLRVNGVAASELAGHYSFGEDRHTLDVDTLQFAAGRYSGRATLQGHAPLALDVQLKGLVQAALPGTGQALPVAASASMRGSLAAERPQFSVRAQLEPLALPPVPSARPGRALLPSTTPLRATLTATVEPWSAQPVVMAAATFSNINLASLWPAAPQTLLTGNAQVKPEGPDNAAPLRWQALLSVNNGLPGPWDKGLLPLNHGRAQLRVTLDEQHVPDVTVETLEAQLGSGQVQGSGRWHGPDVQAGWQGQLVLRQLNPATLHSRLAPAAVDGRLQAQAQGAGAAAGIAFSAALQPSAAQPATSALRGLRLRRAQAEGRWAGGTLDLRTLLLQTDDAQLQGELNLRLANGAARGKLQGRWPGASVDLAGRLAPADGDGQFTLQVTDAGPALRWLGQWPGLPEALARSTLTGKGDLTGRWQGGWQRDGAGLRLDARLGVPQLTQPAAEAARDPTAAPDWRLRDLVAELHGTLDALALEGRAALDAGRRRAQWQGQASGGRRAGGAWEGRLVANTLRLEDPLVGTGAWTLQQRAPVDLRWRPDGGGFVAEAGAGEAALTGPMPGTATLAWQPVTWAQGPNRQELRSRGALRGLPQAWLTLLAGAGGTDRAAVDLVGDLVFDGNWNVQLAQALQLEATLARRSGDLQLLANDEGARNIGIATTGGRVSAGVREAALTLRSDGTAVQLGLRWDSERAGQARAELATRLARGPEGWDWPADAPLTGSLQASLPRLGVWSVFAPPAWRMRGTLEARIALAGTRQVPQWNGTLQADDLALRAVAEGIEFNDGRLRATLQGQRLDVQTFELHGARGAGTGAAGDGGLLSAQGQVLWLTDVPANATLLTRLRMDLQAQAKALRVSARADRRLSVSGELRAQLREGRLALRGSLAADQALFILPDENTPTLGDDVVVRTRGPGNAGKAGAPANAAAPVRNGPDIELALDLGRDFRLQGRGVTTKLAGQLTLRSSPAVAAGAPRLVGEVRTVLGSYKAYGQQLDIEEGVLRFTGPYDNPALDVLAIRPNLTQRVGVQITGTALAPRIRLYADPELSDAEKLAWLVLGRAAASGAAESAVLQQAAIALLGSKKGFSGGIAETLGLDELSVRGSSSSADGSATSAAITLGKRLSRNFYVAYERSLAGTLGTFYIFYDLSRRFTLRAQTGEQSAVDLIFTLPYD